MNIHEMYVQSLLEDEASRVKFQHEFALAGFRTLILINGGAVISLLTYAGNVLDREAAATLGFAFLLYVIGLSVTTLAYVFAYFSQGMFISVNNLYCQMAMQISNDPKKDEKKAQLDRIIGNIFIAMSVIFTIIGLGCFVGGSFCAMTALT